MIANSIAVDTGYGTDNAQRIALDMFSQGKSLLHRSIHFHFLHHDTYILLPLLSCVSFYASIERVGYFQDLLPLHLGILIQSGIESVSKVTPDP